MIKTLNAIILILILVHLGLVAADLGLKFVLSGPAVLEMLFFGAILLLQRALGKLQINEYVVVIVMATVVVGYLSVTGVNV